MASAQVEQERADALLERRKAGDKAWSPSRAREALRTAWNGTTDMWRQMVEAEEHKAFESSDRFKDWCWATYGEEIDL